MFLYLRDASSLIAESLSRIVSTQFLDKVSSVPGYTTGELDSIDSLKDLVVGLHRIRTRERRRAREKLKHKNTWNDEDVDVSNEVNKDDGRIND